MFTAADDAASGLIRSGFAQDGIHTGVALSREVNAGRMVRLRRGVYVSMALWLGCAPWDRHLLTTAATAMSHPQPVFCRETALVLHGVPLLSVPSAVHIRTATPGASGTKHHSPMTGKLSGRELRKILQAHSRDGGPHLSPHIFSGFPTTRIEPALPRGRSRPEHRRLLSSGRENIPRAALPAERFPALDGGHGYHAEPLPHVLADTVPRMPGVDAVVVLDAIRSGRCGHAPMTLESLEALTDDAGSLRLRRNWELAVERSDPLAESAGESWARMRFDELGFQVPTLQMRVAVEGHRYRVDFAWEDAGVVAEFDGRVKYLSSRDPYGPDSSSVVYDEKLREDLIRSTGLRVIRISWADLRDSRRLESILRRAGVPKKG